jgi:hypothetical protein
MDAIESQIQIAAESLLTTLRQAGGIDQGAATKLKDALRAAAAAWAHSSTISKSAANLFVDLASGIESVSHAYPADEAAPIRMLADEVAALVRACVELP